MPRLLSLGTYLLFDMHQDTEMAQPAIVKPYYVPTQSTYLIMHDLPDRHAVLGQLSTTYLSTSLTRRHPFLVVVLLCINPVVSSLVYESFFHDYLAHAVVEFGLRLEGNLPPE